jgi:predicted transposase YdaD
MVMAHLKTKATTRDLTQRKQWKWNIVRPLYQKGLTRFDIINLVKFIDKMMTLPPPLQTEFNDKLEQHEKELNMPFLSTIEEMAEERGEAKGEIKGARKTCRNNIIKILANRFDSVPELMSDSLKKIDDMTILENLLLASISVHSLAELQKLIDAELQQNQ